MVQYKRVLALWKLLACISQHEQKNLSIEVRHVCGAVMKYCFCITCLNAAENISMFVANSCSNCFPQF